MKNVKVNVNGNGNKEISINGEKVEGEFFQGSHTKEEVNQIVRIHGEVIAMVLIRIVFPQEAFEIEMRRRLK